VDLGARPILVFWETTRQCGLACRHCRASAIREPLPGELTTAEAARFVERLARFGPPSPVLVATGGDVLERRDLDALLDVARAGRTPVALAPSVTPLLSERRIAALRHGGVRVVSISLDGATAATHDGVRGVEGHFAETLAAIARLRRHGIVVQINTVAMRATVDELAGVAHVVRELGAAIWEVFFLVHVGRGADLQELTPEENEHVCHFLVDASRHGFVVRTVEAPFFRRVAAARAAGAAPPSSGLYRRLVRELGAGAGPAKARTKGTRDGRGIVFVAHDGEIFPSGFLPLPLGNVKRDDLASVYREHPLLRRIRAADFGGRCGSCAYRELCGGSRARAFAASGDPLAEDPACAYGSEAAPGRSGGR